MGAADNLAHVAVFDALPVVVVAKLFIIVVKVFVKLPTIARNFNYVFNLVFSSCTKLLFYKTELLCRIPKLLIKKNY
jgi:hypothetical protein